MKLPKHNIGGMLQDTGLGKDILDMTPKAQAASGITSNQKASVKGNTVTQIEEATYSMGENICKLLI